MLARAEIVVLFDDDDRPAPDLLAEHLAAHAAHPEERVAILGYTEWAPELEVTPLMHFLTDVDKLLFAYGNLVDGQRLDWRGFWEGRLSCKRSLLMRHALHDQRLVYSIDVEMAWRLAPLGLEVRYHEAARSHMARPIDLAQFCARIEAKGRAQARIALLHDDPVIRSYTKVDNAADLWAAAAPALDDTLSRVQELEASDLQPDERAELYRLYRELFAALYAKGVVEASRSEVVSLPPMAPPLADPSPPPPGEQPTVAAKPSVVARPAAPVHARTHRPTLVARTDAGDWSAAPALTVTIPVWSRTEELAEMAQRTIERIHEVASLDTEIVVIDNGSPFVRPLRADVHRFDENQGVSVAWNAGIEVARAEVVAVLNSDCMVERGWDAALYEAATEGRRIAFPYTDHADGQGFRCPDQAGTAGWCFMMSRDVYDEVGAFDERFSPAYGEDTDYWHRAWELGIELTPVPAARVTHARRTTSSTDPHVDWLLQAHRYKYGWKHGVDPLRAPPYYNRPVLEFVGRVAAT
jgi:GT2 family glycosyltransferase